MQESRIISSEIEVKGVDALSSSRHSGTQKGKKKAFKKEWLICIICVSLPFIGYVIFNAFPIGISLASMFTDIDHNQISTMSWNDFAHFKTFFRDAKYLHALGITLWLTCAQFVSLLVALIVAVLLKAQKRGSRIFQTLFFVPYICSMVAVSIMWSWVFSGSDAGVLNSILGSHKDWIGDANSLTWCIFTTLLWQAPGYGIVMLTAALTGIDGSLYEAAEIDGANAWQKFIKITIPQIAPMILFLALAAWQTGLTTFDAATVLAPITWKGTAGIEDMGLTVSYYSYIQGISFSHMDYASVINWMTAIINFAGAFLFLRLRTKAEDNLG